MKTETKAVGLRIVTKGNVSHLSKLNKLEEDKNKQTDINCYGKARLTFNLTITSD